VSGTHKLLLNAKLLHPSHDRRADGARRSFVADLRSIYVPDDGYLAKCAEICKKHNVLLICDEIQTGLCRTGKM
jgi:hypothetical protein